MWFWVVEWVLVVFKYVVGWFMCLLCVIMWCCMSKLCFCVVLKCVVRVV